MPKGIIPLADRVIGREVTEEVTLYVALQSRVGPNIQIRRGMRGTEDGA